MESNRYPVAEKCRQEWQCGNHIIHNPYIYMQDAKNVRVSSWAVRENKYASRWFQHKRLEEKIRTIKNKNKKAYYSGITKPKGLLYASQGMGSGNMETVLLSPNFELLRTLLNCQTTDDMMQIFTVSLCPANDRLIACSALKDGAVGSSVIVRDIGSEVALAKLDESFSFTWSSDGKHVYSTNGEQSENESLKNDAIRWKLKTGQQETTYMLPGNAAFLNLKSELINIKMSGIYNIHYIGGQDNNVPLYHGKLRSDVAGYNRWT